MGGAMKKILVAEDNLPLATILEFNLSRAGFAVTLARNGQRAAEIAQREAFDLIMTDYQMPGLNGEELCASIRRDSLNSDVPIVLCSAKGLEVDVSRLSSEYGVLEVFCKPFSPSEIVEFALAMFKPEKVGT